MEKMKAHDPLQKEMATQKSRMQYLVSFFFLIELGKGLQDIFS
jgi:hypothetical protein